MCTRLTSPVKAPITVQRGEREYGGQAVTHPSRITRVRNLTEPVQQARDILGYGLGVFTRLAKSRRDRR